MTKLGDSLRIRYDEGCLAAHALNLIGDRWALLVVRELMFAPKRFQMLREGMPGVSPSVLNGRLEQLRDAGVLTHDPRLGIYALTAAGRGLLPVLESLCRWALAVPGHDHRRFISPSALMISMGVNLRRAQSLGQTMIAGFEIGREAFEMRLEAGHLHTVSLERAKGDFTFFGTGNALAIAIYGPMPLIDVVESGAISLRGDLDAAQSFVDLFSLSPQETGDAA